MQERRVGLVILLYGRHLVVYLVAGIVVLLFQSGLFVVGTVLCLAVVGAHSVLGIVHGFVGHIAKSLTAYLFFIFASYASYLLYINTALYQFCYNLLLGCAFLVFLHYELHHLVVGHRRLCRCTYRYEHYEKDKCDKFFHIYMLEFFSCNDAYHGLCRNLEVEP